MRAEHEPFDVARLNPGDKVRTVQGSVAEVIKPSEDGVWVLVRYVSAGSPDLEGTEDLCSGEDLAGVMEEPASEQPE